ncbi:MAG: hypothetical protein KAI24_06180 [Planctomycetes bacterium]|nr:hypothetical protein [Planctomycetota bacterium]
MKTSVIRALLAAALPFAACSSAPEPRNELGVDAIVVTYSPSGAMDAADLRRVEITDIETIDLWVRTFAAVPDMPERGIRFIRFKEPVSQHRVEFRRGDEVVRVARMRSGQLAVGSHKSWAFYSGEDRAFTALVNALVPGT